MLETYIRERLQNRRLLLMTHIIIGYPSLDASLKIVDAMVEAGVDLMELQIPFSEPIADGPVILRANQHALANHTTVDDCLAFAHKVTARHHIPFVFMSYYNIAFTRGIARFTNEMCQANIRGAIIPDLPHEEGREYLSAMRTKNLEPIFLFSPNTTKQRLNEIASNASGFIYCIARKGVTGAETLFAFELEEYFKRCRAATNIPLAVGFGVRKRDDLKYLHNKVDIAVIGSETIRVLDEQGTLGVSAFIKDLLR
ncbi:MAG: tryptophan synthase subunit alpha, partial [Deltaproteobacteria bacterium]|nr:tryptophan synthase subunit alpha [Deltaproteobacteria bacterium]